MTREDIIDLWSKANGWSPAAYRSTLEDLERFAVLVAAAERENVAAWMIQRGYATGHGDTTEDLLKELDWQIDERIAAEREACAKVLDDMADDMAREMEPSTAIAYVRSKATAIRARSNT